MRIHFFSDWIVRLVLQLCLTVVLAAVPGYAQDSPALYPVHGTVENRITHQPIARALVSSDKAAVLTDNNGGFELLLPEGNTFLQFRRPGYEGRNFGSRVSPEDFYPIQVSANTPAQHMFLTPLSSVTGHVSLSNGDEADGIQLLVYGKQPVGGNTVWSIVQSATTNTDGIFHIPQISAGSYIVCSMPSSTQSDSAAVGFPPVCYPSASDFSSATPINLVAGQSMDINLSLTKQPFYHVSIAVPGHSPGSGMALEIRDQSGRQLGFPTEWDKKRGVWIVEAPNGIYTATARAWGDSPSYGKVNFVVADAPVSGLTMTLHTIQPITIRVQKNYTNTNGDPATVAAANQTPLANVIFFHADSKMEAPESTRLRALGTDIYETTGITPGQYWISASPSYGYISSISSGGTDLTSTPLILEPGSGSSPIDITFRNDGGQIDVSLSSSMGGGSTTGTTSSSNNVYVCAIPQFSSAAIRCTLVTKTSTNSLRNLFPGTYSVMASSEPLSIDIHDAATMRRISDAGQTVSVSSGSTASVRISALYEGNAEGGR